MSRIQFRVTEEEFSIIEKNATKAGCSNISQFVKEVALIYPNKLNNSNMPNLSFIQLWPLVEKAINEYADKGSHGETFVLNDIGDVWLNIPLHNFTGNTTNPLRGSLGTHFRNIVEKDEQLPKEKKVFPYIRRTGKTIGRTAVYEIYKNYKGEETKDCD